MLFHGQEPRAASDGATEPTSRTAATREDLAAWMEEHRKAHLMDAATKQYDSAVASAVQFGCGDLQEVFTAEERRRCRLDGGEEEDGTRRENVEVVAAPAPAHELRERDAAAAEGRAMRHPYKGMPLTGAPASRFPLYLQPRHFDRFPDLDAHGHAPETLDTGAAEHDDCATGWMDNSHLYVTGAGGAVVGVRGQDGAAASAVDLRAEAERFSRNFAVDTRFCHTFNHSHICKPTCFKNAEKKPSDVAGAPAIVSRGACRFRFWRLVLVLDQVLRRMGKALVPEPVVADADDANNEYGRCKVCRANCFRGSSNDVCQTCLRCNVDMQYQNRTFPLRGRAEAASSSDGAADHALNAASQKADARATGVTSNALPGLLRGLAVRVRNGKDIARELLSSFAIAARSSHVADFYATKYLAKPQQWLANVLGPLIAGFRRVEAKKEAAQEQPSIRAQALRNVRTAIFAANRSVWISCCEACLYLQTGSSAVQSHPDVVILGRKALFMMHECKRILNGDVAGAGLWEADLSTSAVGEGSDALRVVMGPAVGDANADEGAEASEEDSTDGGKVEDKEIDKQAVSVEGIADEAAMQADPSDDRAPEHVMSEAEHGPAVAEQAHGSAVHGEVTAEEEAVSGKQQASVQIFRMTVTLRDDWLHRGDALQDMDLHTYAEHVHRKQKPARGARLQDELRTRLFAFDAHYQLAKDYVQELKVGPKRAIARFNMPNCLRESVNEGEENAQFKAAHCSLLRCPGAGRCADPLLCAPTLFPGKDGRRRFRPAWRARDREIVILALRGQAKKLQARRLETVHDTSLCKTWRAARGGSESASAADHDSTQTDVLAGKPLQIELQCLFRQRIRSLRENAPAEVPCVFGYPERLVHAILGFLGQPLLWHAEQLHLAEWQALQQLEFLLNLTANVDGKNDALDKLKAQKGGARAAAELITGEPLNPLPGHAVEEFDAEADDDRIPPDEPVGGAVVPVTDQQQILRLLGRDDEVALARRRGQGNREGAQNMREAADAFGAPGHPRSQGRDPSLFGAAEHDKASALARHHASRDALRERLENEGASVEGPDGGAGTVVPEMAVERVERVDETRESLGPAALAQKLCEEAGLTLEQRAPVALIARDMQRVYEAEMQRRSNLPEAQREDLAGRSLLPLSGRVSRMLLFGGGGCGKTRIINMALSPLFRRFYGYRGLVKTAFANKPARLIHGRTTHTIIKMRGQQSLTMPRLRVQSDKERRALAALWAPVGALLKDEFTQQPATLEHALAVRATYGRERSHGLRPADYAQPETNYASIPFVVSAGDPLQFPPVPAISSLLSIGENQSREHRVGQHIFQQQDYVCELKATMRFRNDLVLTRILQKMRSPGEDRSALCLTDAEWRALQSTDIAHGASLDGTELWYHAAFAWSYVCVAQWLRSSHSASHHGETLFAVAARDHILKMDVSVDASDFCAVRDKLLKIPNMNSTGRLPAVALLHVNMKVRLTVTVCRCQAPVDTVGTITHIELDAMDRSRWQQDPSSGLRVLHSMPTVLVRIDESEMDTGLGPGVIAVQAVFSEAFSAEVKLPAEVKPFKVSAKREQLPLTIVTASTLYTLQGSTATPGLIYHWRTPKRLSKEMKWICAYMALSRVESLKNFRSIGINDAIRELIDNGPPGGALTRFLELFQEKAVETEKAAQTALKELGWLSPEDA